MTIDADAQFMLSVDKLSLTFRDHDDDRIQRTADRLIHMVESGQWINAQLRPGNRHRLQCKIPINGFNQSLILEVAARHRDTSAYRLEYNPWKIGDHGRSRVNTILDSIFEQGSRQLLMAGKVTRIDAALDLHELSVNDVLVRHRGMRRFMVVSTRGRPRSLYHGNSKSNQAVIYDRSDEGAKILRIEKRLKPNCLGADLLELKNPFTRIQLVPVNLIIPVLDGLNLEHLCDSIRLRGFRHVLAALTSRQRKGIENVLTDTSHSLLPSPDLIWSHWPSALHECGLLGDTALSEAAE